MKGSAEGKDEEDEEDGGSGGPRKVRPSTSRPGRRSIDTSEPSTLTVRKTAPGIKEVVIALITTILCIAFGGLFLQSFLEGRLLSPSVTNTTICYHFDSVSIRNTPLGLVREDHEKTCPRLHNISLIGQCINPVLAGNGSGRFELRGNILIVALNGLLNYSHECSP